MATKKQIYEAIIGLEIHVQLKTKSKMFCSCSNEGENREPNTTVCPVCMGHPGTLPVANRQALDWATMVGLALDCQVAKVSKFDRKNYFYPDLPKGYQISQFDLPVAKDGFLLINTNSEEQKKIRIKRVHLEEDAAKLLHKDKKTSLVDYNRTGTPLIEIVTEPDLRTPEEAKVFLQELKLLMQYLEVSDADMEKGHLRCDANISIRPYGKIEYYTLTEIKNLNSFSAVEKALAYENKRQTKLWRKEEPPKEKTTRGWNETKGKTIEQRGKEESHDYRYFPEPDLPPFKISQQEIERLKIALPELPQQKRQRFLDQYGFKMSEVKILTSSKKLANYIEQIITELKAWLVALEETQGTEDEIWEKDKKKLSKLVSGWVTTELFKLLKENNKTIKENPINAENFAEFLTIVYQNKVNSSAAQVLLKEMFKRGGDPSMIMEEKSLAQVSDESELGSVIEKVINSNPEPVAQYKKGKENAVQFLVGQVMKETKGKADPQVVLKMLKEGLGK